MKKYILLTVAPALALLAVGCSSPVAMQSSEYDDMYYSSSDQTVYVEPAAAQPQQPAQAYQQYENSHQQAEPALAEGEVLNPEYSESNITQNYAGDEYYDGRAYDARDNWYRPDYSFVDPYWGSAYVPRRASYAFYDPFYDPFYYDPFYYDPFWSNARFRTGVSISFNYGWGGGFYRHPYYGYSNWWPHSYGHGYYNGYYRGYNNGYYAHNPYGWYNDRPVVIGKASRVQYGPRDSRNTQVVGNTAAGRPSRDGTIRSESTGQQQSVGRQSRSSRSTVAPATGGRQELPARPSRSSRSTTVRPQQQQQQQNAQPAPSRSTRSTRQYVPSQTQEQPQQRREVRTRTIERQPSRTYEQRSQPARIERSQPSRTEESRPSRTYESRPSSSPSPSPSINRSSNSSSSSGGGRPSRGNN
ncbi:hypothetical protein [Pontibacter litorisediminis]|uniref:hypothetical protein n=1 Tax=Pontibacter litorisediminis TaxID=1846260 RepID=UPI0023EB896D|nr:hypothetical protein [Pontibacter litorisediminis]